MFARTKQEYLLTYYNATEFQHSLHFLLSAVIYLINISRGSYRPLDINPSTARQRYLRRFSPFQISLFRCNNAALQATLLHRRWSNPPAHNSNAVCEMLRFFGVTQLQSVRGCAARRGNTHYKL